MRHILPVIVIAQFLCTSLWFAGNAVMEDLAKHLNVDALFLGHLTSAVQLGFIAGTLCYALLAVADRFSPSKVFFWSALLAALFNLGLLLHQPGLWWILLSRGLTGFFLAGIYPVGMKIASDYYKEGLGKSLGFLLGALVAGTALPHLLRGMSMQLSWDFVMVATSILAITGGVMILILVPDGPFRTPGQRLHFKGVMAGFSDPRFRTAAFGYFGHMWELYTFWAFVPVMLAAYNLKYPGGLFNIPVWSFAVIFTGSLTCILAGFLARRYGAHKVATWSLTLSCACCLLSPYLGLHPTELIFLSFMFVWGGAVIADSPMFSTMVARYAPPDTRASSLTIVNCIGFSITIISIQCINLIKGYISSQYLFLVLALGPLLGLFALYSNARLFDAKADRA